MENKKTQRNWQQEQKLLEFMRANTGIARNFTKSDPVATAALWMQITSELNQLGPPIKTVDRWKKAWMDWKSTIKRKLAHNRSEINATGGGVFNQYVLSANETEVAQICGLFSIVKGVTENVSASGVPQRSTSSAIKKTVVHDAQIIANNNELPPAKITEMDISIENSFADKQDDPISIEDEFNAAPGCSNTLKSAEKPKSLNNLMESEIEAFNKIATKIDKTNHILEDICNVLKEATEENRNHNRRMELIFQKLVEKEN